MWAHKGQYEDDWPIRHYTFMYVHKRASGYGKKIKARLREHKRTTPKASTKALKSLSSAALAAPSRGGFIRIPAAVRAASPRRALPQPRSVLPTPLVAPRPGLVTRAASRISAPAPAPPHAKADAAADVRAYFNATINCVPADVVDHLVATLVAMGITSFARLRCLACLPDHSAWLLNFVGGEVDAFEYWILRRALDRLASDAVAE